MGIRVAWIVGLLLSTTSCLSFDESICAGTGRVCPPGTRCSADGECIPLTCGNGKIEGVEQCEPAQDGRPADLNGLTCASFGSKIEDGLACAENCKLDKRLCSECGNEVMEPGEQCDGSDFGPGGPVDCRDPRAGFYDPGTVRCSSICTWDVSVCTGRCGDGIRNGQEACDGAAPFGESCLDHGFDGGRLACSQCGRAFGGCTQLGWRRIGSPTTEQFSGIWGTSSEDLFVVGTTRTILRWNGTLFTQVAPPTTDTLTGVWGSSPTNVFFVGFTTAGVGIIQRYDGASVTSMTIPAGLPRLRAIWGSAANDIYAVGDGGTLLHFNGAWTQVLGVTPMKNLKAIWGRNATDIFIVGEGGAVLHYDGTWSTLADPLDSPITGPNVADLAGVWGSAANNVFAVSRRREIYKFNGTWTQNPVATPPVGTADSNVAVIGGAGDDVFVLGTDPAVPATPALLHFDGVQWVKLVPPTTGNQQVIAAWQAPNGDFWGVGAAGFVVRWGGAGWTIATNPAPANLRAVSAFGPSDAFAVGASGAVRRYNGFGWVAGNNTSSTLTSVWALSSTFASAVGVAGTYRHTTDGTNWNMVASPSVNERFAVWGFAANDIFSGGNDGSIHRFNTSWSAAPSPPDTIDVFGLWGSSPTNVFAVGQNPDTNTAVAYRFDGSNWVDQGGTLASGTALLQGVWGAAADHVFAVGDSIFHFGTKWARMTPDGRALHAVSGISPRNVFAVGDTGRLLHYDGIDWTPMRVLATDGSTVATNLRGVAATSRSLILVGDGFVQRLSFSRRQTEVNCQDTWDDDADGMPDCADADCSTNAFCEGGGACAIAQETLECGTTINSTTVGRSSARDNYLCSTHEETGPDVIYRFESMTSRPVTVTLTSIDGADLDVVVMGAMTASDACDPDFACESAGATSAATETAAFTATAGRPYYVAVDGNNDAAGKFTLTVTCP